MSEKPKRKRSPNRHFKTLFFIIILLSLIVYVTSLSIYLLRPQGAKIVYLAPNESGFNAIWKADLANPEHPEQLTNLLPNAMVLDYQITDDGTYLIYSLNIMGSSKIDTIMHNTKTSEEQYLRSCSVEMQGCAFHLRPDGAYLVYVQNSLEENTLHVLDLTTLSDTIIHQIERSGSDYRFHDVSPNWMGNTGLLTYSLSEEPHQIQVYDVEQNNALITLPLERSDRILAPTAPQPYFSPDGSSYAYRTGHPDNMPVIVEIRKTHNPERLISIPQADGNEAIAKNWAGTYIYDWHPDNEHLLIGSEYLVPQAAAWSIINLQIFNTTNGSIVQLTEGNRFSYDWATFNHDGSQILYQRKDTLRQCDSFCDQIMIYNMETNKHTAYPIFGAHPQWLNGGRN